MTDKSKEKKAPYVEPTTTDTTTTELVAEAVVVKGDKGLLKDLFDNDTLIIIGLMTLAIMNPELADKVIAGMLAFMGLKNRPI